MRKARHRSITSITEKPRFVLWREVVVAYVAPAVIAGVGGLVSGRTSLLVAAFTSIGISSAVVAVLIGTWLRRLGPRHAWLTSTPWFAAVAGAAIGAALAGGLAGWLVNMVASAWSGGHPWPWPDDLGIDLPVSAAIAAAIITGRWRAAQRTPASSEISDASGATSQTS